MSLPPTFIAPEAPALPKAFNTKKKLNPKDVCSNLSAGSVTKRYIDENWGNPDPKAQKKARKVLTGLQDACEATDGCEFFEHSAKCKAKKRASSKTKKTKASSKAKKTKAASKPKKTARSATPPSKKRARSASPAKKGVSLPALRKKGIANLTKDELVEFIKRTRVAAAKKAGKKVSDMPALPGNLSSMTKAQLVTKAKTWNNKL